MVDDRATPLPETQVYATPRRERPRRLEDRRRRDHDHARHTEEARPGEEPSDVAVLAVRGQAPPEHPGVPSGGGHGRHHHAGTYPVVTHRARLRLSRGTPSEDRGCERSSSPGRRRASAPRSGPMLAARGATVGSGGAAGRPARGGARPSAACTLPSRAPGRSTSVISTPPRRSCTRPRASGAGVDCLVNNAGDPRAHPGAAPHARRRRPRDGRQLPRAGPHVAGAPPRLAGARRRVRGQRVEPRRARPDRQRGGVLREQVRAVRVDRGHGRRPPRHRRRGEAGAARARSTPRSGTSPATSPPPTRVRSCPRPTPRESVVDAIEGDGFEWYAPPEFPGGGPQHDDRRRQEQRPGCVRRRDGHRCAT